MKNIFIIAILLITNICVAQTVTNVTENDVLIKEYRDSTLVILKKDSSLLKQGNYKLTSGRVFTNFEINSFGQVDGNFLAYRDNGNLGRKTTIKDGRMIGVINYTREGILSDSTVYGFQNIELYDNVSKKFLPKKCWVKHKFSINTDGKHLDYETLKCAKQTIMTKTFHKNNEIKRIELNGNYENVYDENGILTARTTYDWKTKEITTLYYEKGKLQWSEIEFNDKYHWENGQVNSIVTIETIELVDGKTVQKANKNYTIITSYYPNGKTKSSETEKNGEIVRKEFSTTGKLLKQESKRVEYAPVMMGN